MSGELYVMLSQLWPWLGGRLVEDVVSESKSEQLALRKSSQAAGSIACKMVERWSFSRECPEGFVGTPIALSSFVTASNPAYPQGRH